MLEGEIVNARVTEVHDFGIYFEHAESRILVLIPEICWRNYRLDLSEFTQVGNVHAVKILRYVDQQETYVGSIKQANPDLNPWKDDGRYAIGTRLTVIVNWNADYGTFVRVVPRLNALILLEDCGADLEVGTEVLGEVVEYDISRNRMRLKRVGI